MPNKPRSGSSPNSRICSRCRLERPLVHFMGKMRVQRGDSGEYRTCDRCRDELRERQRDLRDAAKRESAREALRGAP